MGNGTKECEWRHAPEPCAEDFGDLRKVSLLSSGLWRRRLIFFGGGLAEARRICALRAPHVIGGVDGKVIIKILCISFPYIETFNSKVIKGFVPELRSRYMFFVFRDSHVIYAYMCMNILCTFHVSVSWVCYKIISTLIRSKISYETWYIWLKTLSFLLHLYPLRHFVIFLIWSYIEKLQKWFNLRKFLKMK